MFQTRRAAIASQIGGPKQMRAHTFGAPIAGWVTADSLIAARPNSALVLDNIFPMQMSARIRGGARIWAEIGEPVRSLMVYRIATGEEMFAGTDTAIYDATTVADVILMDQDGDPLTDQDDEELTIGDAAPVVVPGQTSGYYSYVNFSTEGGNFMPVVNGTDDLQLYDGTDWQAVNATSTPVSITGVDTDGLSHVSAYRERLFFVEKDTFNVWYLPVNSIGGAASLITLAGLFSKGGSVLFTATWSMYAGDGLDDKFVVVSTEGEVAVFQGDNPGDANSWSLVGRYEITAPMGPRGHFRAGGDLLILTREGIVPISKAIEKDAAALSLDAVSQAIEPDWSRESRSRVTRPWEFAKWTRENVGLVSMPNISEDVAENYQFVVNIETGAWCRYTGWDVQCTDIYQDWLYFGTRDGFVVQGELGGQDLEQPYVASYAGNWDPMGALGSVKTVHQARATFLTTSDVTPQLSVSTDYTIRLPAPPNAPFIESAASLWDVGLWDVAVWDENVQPYTFSTRWTSIGRTGYAIAPQVQLTSGSLEQPTAQLVEVTMTYEIGGLVV